MGPRALLWRAVWGLTCLMAAGPTLADGPGISPIVSAWLKASTDIYPHNVLGALRPAFVLAARTAARTADGRTHRVDLRGGPRQAVFEDIAPRAWSTRMATVRRIS